MGFKRISSSAQLNISLAVDFSVVISNNRVAMGSGSPRGASALPRQYFGKLSRPRTWYWPRVWGSREEAQCVAPPQGTLPQPHPETNRLPADPSPTCGGRSASRICYSWSHHSPCSLSQPTTERLGFWGAIHRAYMGHNVGYLHVEVQACILAACQPLIRVRPKHVPVPLLGRLCWKESWLQAGKEMCCTWTLLALTPGSGLCSAQPSVKRMCLSCPGEMSSEMFSEMSSSPRPAKWSLWRWSDLVLQGQEDCSPLLGCNSVIQDWWKAWASSSSHEPGKWRINNDKES